MVDTLRTSPAPHDRPEGLCRGGLALFPGSIARKQGFLGSRKIAAMQSHHDRIGHLPDPRKLATGRTGIPSSLSGRVARGIAPPDHPT
jgi:hypothetical protein